ncbi:MAG: ABC-type transport system involved in cytochrome bd biosynthesis fused ATPase/permease subunit [Acidimicrobiales bacterium]|jgi:ABC-type transport system involved in cytochrome bd biosynthesis fused ATPase/permease subunit
MTTESDPVRIQRAKVADLVSKGLRLGTALYVLASVIFFIGFMTGFTSTVVTLVIGLLVAGSALLAPALVFKYGVKAAERADRDDSW